MFKFFVASSTGNLGTRITELGNGRLKLDQSTNLNLRLFPLREEKRESFYRVSFLTAYTCNNWAQFGSISVSYLRVTNNTLLPSHAPSLPLPYWKTREGTWLIGEALRAAPIGQKFTLITRRGICFIVVCRIVSSTRGPLK